MKQPRFGYYNLNEVAIAIEAPYGTEIGDLPLLETHEHFIDAMEHVVGEQDQIAMVCIGPSDDMELRRREIAEAIARTDTGEGVIVLTDLFGGTPSNLAISLLEAGRVIIGRARDSEIHIDRKYVSRHHAQLVTSPEGCFVEDLNSTNGIQLNGTPVQKQLLKDGDKVSIDTNEFIYHDLRNADDRDDVEDTRAG